MTEQHIHDAGRENKYFSLMLHMADDDLNPYQYRLLGHYRRVCGDSGTCWESTDTTAEKCKMSAGKVVSTRRELAALGYIHIEERGNNETLLITVMDRMSENVARYSQHSPYEQGTHVMNAGTHHMNAGVHDMKQRRIPEEESFEEESFEEEKQQQRARESERLFEGKEINPAIQGICNQLQALGVPHDKLPVASTLQAWLDDYGESDVSYALARAEITAETQTLRNPLAFVLKILKDEADGAKTPREAALAQHVSAPTSRSALVSLGVRYNPDGTPLTREQRNATPYV